MPENSPPPTLDMVRTLRRVLRRLKFAAPGARTVGGSGCARGHLEEAAPAEGLMVDMAAPDVWIAWHAEGGEAPPALPGTVRAAALISPNAGGLLPWEAGRRPATGVATLREWVRGWPLGGLWRALMAPEATGGRSCVVELPGVWECLSTRESTGPVAAPKGSPWHEAAVTACGIGRFPLMPATLVCAVMLAAALALRPALGGDVFRIVCAGVAVVSALWGAALESWARGHYLAEDPREFVLDEVAGQALTWAFLAPSAPWWMLIAGFLLFRLFDIWKFGVSWIERVPVPGVVVWDDLLAGLYAGLGLLALAAVVGA